MANRRKSKNPKRPMPKGVEVILRLDEARVVSLAGREATAADELAVEYGMDRPRTHTVTLNGDDAEDAMPMMLVGPDEEPPNAIYTAGLDGGLSVIYRREVIIESWLINIAMLFSWNSDPVVDFRDEDEKVLEFAREQWHVVYPFMASHASTMYKLLGRVHGIGELPENIVMTFDTVDEVYSSPVADDLRQSAGLR